MTIYDWEIEDNLWRTPQNIIPIWISAPDLKQSILKRYGEYSYIVYFDIKGHYEARAIEKHNEKEAARLNMSIQELVDLSYEKIIQIGARGLFGGLTIPLEQKLEKEKEHYGPQKPQFLWKYGEYEFYEQIDRCWWPQGDRNYKRLFYKHWDQEINLIGKAWHVEWWTGFQILSVNWRTIEVRNKYNDWYTKGDEVYTFSLDDFWAKEQARTTVRSLLEAKKEKHELEEKKRSAEIMKRFKFGENIDTLLRKIDTEEKLDEVIWALEIHLKDRANSSQAITTLRLYKECFEQANILDKKYLATFLKDRDYTSKIAVIDHETYAVRYETCEGSDCLMGWGICLMHRGKRIKHDIGYYYQSWWLRDKTKWVREITSGERRENKVIVYYKDGNGSDRSIDFTA